MAQVRIVTSWDRMTPVEIIAEARFIVSKMSGNINFPASTPPLATVTSQINEFEEANTEAEDGGSYDRSARDSKELELVNTMHTLAAYVLMQAAGSALVVESSGFKLAKNPSPVPPIEKPMGLRLTDGVNAGELFLKFTKVKGARSYMYQIAEGPLTDDTQWTTYYGTIRQNLFSGLTGGKKYWVRVAAVGTDGQVVYSDAVSRIAQ